MAMIAELSELTEPRAGSLRSKSSFFHLFSLYFFPYIY